MTHERAATHRQRPRRWDLQPRRPTCLDHLADRAGRALPVAVPENGPAPARAKAVTSTSGP